MKEKVTCNGSDFINSGYLTIGCNTCRFVTVDKTCLVQIAESKKKSKLGKSRAIILSNYLAGDSSDCSWWAAAYKQCRNCQMLDSENFTCLETYEEVHGGAVCRKWCLSDKFNKFEA